MVAVTDKQEAITNSVYSLTVQEAIGKIISGPAPMTDARQSLKASATCTCIADILAGPGDHRALQLSPG